MNANRARYYVWHGSCTSKQACYTLKDVYDFIAFCLRENTPITGVTKA